MRYLTLFAAILATVAVGTAYAYEEELTVGVGEQKIMSVPAGSDVTFTGPLHIKQLDSGRIKVIGDSPGWGSVTVKSGSDIFQYSVTIVAIPPEQTIAKLKSLMGGLPLTYSAGGGQVVVEGRIETTQELERFNRVIDMFPGVVNMVVVAAKEPMIDIAVTLVEVEVANSSGLGILDVTAPSGAGSLTGSFPLSDVTAGKVDAGDIKVSFGLTSQLVNALNAQIENGQAKVIANPRIVTLNRKQAQITSGGDIPYRVISATGAQGVEYKPYGIRLTVTPEERANDVLLQLELESSEPVGTVSGASENPLTSRSVNLEVAVEKDMTLAIAGLYNAVTSRATRSGCFFPLFATEAASRRREIVVLVTPRVTLDGIKSDYYRMVTPKDMRR
jgi:pilus assembly protein CpaC